MNRLNLCVIFVLLVLASGVIQAEPSVTLKAIIPFEFIVRDEAFPPGEYVIQKVTPSLLRIQGETAAAFMLSSRVLTPRKFNSEEKLIFNRYRNNRTFLSRVMPKGFSANEVIMCDSEKALVETYWEVDEVALNVADSTVSLWSGR